MAKLQITITQIYARRQRGHSKSMTIEGASLKQAFNRIKELFDE